MVSFVADLDGDGDMDVLVGLERTGTIAWYENLDGLGNFGPARVIGTNVTNVSSVIAVDVDGDGALDVLAVSPQDDSISLYKNLDGQGNFGSGQVIITHLGTPWSVSAADFDGDGDMDLSVASWTGIRTAWFENLDGQGTYGDPHIIALAEESSAGYAAIGADVNGNGYMDLITDSTLYGKLVWYENLDGLGNFSTEKVINEAIFQNERRFITLVDMDNDGDIDILFISHRGELAWIENLDGQGTFGPRQFIAQVPSLGGDAVAADYDGDGDIDIVAATYHNVSYIENLGGLGTPDFHGNSIVTYPNPVTNTLFIDSIKETTVKSVMLFDIMGKKLIDEKGDIQQLDMSSFSNGLYLLKIENENGFFTEKIIKE